MNKNTEKPDLRIKHMACLWLLQQRMSFLGITYWRTIHSSPFLYELENAVTIIRNRKLNTQQKIYWMHCFNCEIDMPVTEDKDVIYCSNCGLKH